ncbi:type VI secretion system baseplate subunit TssE [Vibrio sp. WZ-1]|uniref:type VI secretion system baseplate subunit TssE n=1 Tax=Vibrio sp. WZ-1 TaxID=3454501 RepID=UPI003F834E10
MLGASIIDKLIDSEPTTRIEKDFPITQQSLLDNLLRDLEAMLNSRVGWTALPDDLLELRYSILNYGLPDFSSMPYSSQDGQKQLCEIVCAAIKEFEPRLREVSVSIANENNSIDRSLSLKISAVCLIDKNMHEVTFNSAIEPVNLGLKLSKAK